MRKKLYQAGILSVMLVIAIIAMSCGTANMGIYSSTLQPTEPDQLCNLIIHREMGITRFNGKPVSWGISEQSRYTKIAIPAGLHTLHYDFFWDSNTTNKLGKFRRKLTYEFLPGHNYEIRTKAGFGASGIFTTVTDRTDKKLSETFS